MAPKSNKSVTKVFLFFSSSRVDFLFSQRPRAEDIKKEDVSANSSAEAPLEKKMV